MPFPKPITVAVLWTARPELHVSPGTEECRLKMAANPEEVYCSVTQGTGKWKLDIQLNI